MRFVVTLDDGADRGVVGGKAASLVRLRPCGLAVPDAIVVTDALARALSRDANDGHGGAEVADTQTFAIENAPLTALDDKSLGELDRAAARIANAPLPDDAARAIEQAMAGLQGERFAVRSSFAGEDDRVALAPGVYESRTNVARADVIGAVRAVLASAFSAGAGAYARARGRRVGAAPLAVLIHRFDEGTAAGHVASAGDHDAGAAASTTTKEHARAETVAVAADAALPVTTDLDATRAVTRDASAVAADATRVWVRTGTLPVAARARLLADAARFARAHGPSDLEWVLVDDAFRFVQARPWIPAHEGTPFAPLSELEPDEDPARWRWDAAHNPLPLSPAQAGLVRLCDDNGGVGFRQRALGGFLFYAGDDLRDGVINDRYEIPEDNPALGEIASSVPASSATVPTSSAGAPGKPSPGAPAPGELRRLFASVEADAQRRLAALGPSPSLDDALAVFLAVYQPLIGAVGNAVRRDRAALVDWLRAFGDDAIALAPVLLTDVPSASQRRRACLEALAAATSPDERDRARARFLAAFGDEATIWDVAEPTQRENPERLVPARLDPRATAHAPSATQAKARALTLLPPTTHEAFERVLERAREAMAVGEDDDALYARAQAIVRHALLRLGDGLVAARIIDARDDVFWLPLERSRSLAREAAQAPALGFTNAAAARALVAAARARDREHRAHPPPTPFDRPPSASNQIVRGFGTGGRAIGPVAHHHPGVAPPANVVLVATSILPTELPLLMPAAIVTETGASLDHVATQARERGLPAVVGAVGATRFLPGTLVLVDADRGLVVPLAEPSARVS